MTVARPADGTYRSGWSVRRALCHAPIGAYGLAEASLAWRQLRPGRVAAARPGDDGTARHRPIASIGHADVGIRLTRLLAGSAWAVVTGDEATGLRVEVPHAAYHRVVRMLTAAWRQTRIEVTGGGCDPAQAAALWRMALLIDGVESRGARQWLPTAASSTAAVLARAARTLAVDASVDTRYGSAGVMLCRPGDVRRLLALVI